MDQDSTKFIQQTFYFIVFAKGTYFRVEIKALSFPIALKEARQRFEGAELFINEKDYYR